MSSTSTSTTSVSSTASVSASTSTTSASSSTSPFKESVWLTRIRSEDKLFHSFRSATETLYLLPMLQSVSPALTVYVDGVDLDCSDSFSSLPAWIKSDDRLL